MVQIAEGKLVLKIGIGQMSDKKMENSSVQQSGVKLNSTGMEFAYLCSRRSSFAWIESIKCFFPKKHEKMLAAKTILHSLSRMEPYVLVSSHA